MPNYRFYTGTSGTAPPNEIVDLVSDEEAISHAKQMLHAIVEVWQGARVVIRVRHFDGRVLE